MKIDFDNFRRNMATCYNQLVADFKYDKTNLSPEAMELMSDLHQYMVVLMCTYNDDDMSDLSDFELSHMHEEDVE